MLQVAYAGYLLVDDAITQYIDNPVYYEPGFNLMSPLEIQGDISDRLYIVVRKRSDDTGLSFDSILSSNLEVSVKDASNGETVPSFLKSNNVYEVWDGDSYPLVLEITNALDLSGSLTTRVRTLDVYIKDITDNSFISFRIITSDENRYFNYIKVKSSDLLDRDTYTSVGRNISMTLSGDSDSYILFSPYAYLKETTKDKSDFSYPLNSIFYQRENTYNNEDYSFSLSSYSDSVILETISVFNVPSYNKAGVIVIDRILYNKIKEIGSNVYVDVGVIGELSGISDTFRVNFSI